jgi:IclR family mhp operon transcriptional activator
MVRSLSRGLDIIYFLNQHHSASPTELATELKVPRATVHRILQTLKEKGYVYQHGSDRKFRLTYRVLSLSQGFSDEDYMANLGMDVM